MKLFFFNIIIFIITVFQAYSQVESFIRTYGIDGFNYGKRIAVLSDTTYMLLCNKTGFYGMTNVYLIHVDKTGNIINEKVFGGNNLFYAEDMTVKGDSIFVITGFAHSSSTQEYDIFVMWIDKELNILEQKIWGGEKWDMGKAIIIDADGYIYPVIETYSHGQKAGIIVFKISPTGWVIDARHFNAPELEEIPTAVTIMNDSLLFVTGGIINAPAETAGFVLKMKKNLLVIDTLYIVKDNHDIIFNDIDVITDNKLAVTGSAYDKDVGEKKQVLIIFDSDMNITAEFWGNSHDTYGKCIKGSFYNNFILTGVHISEYGGGSSDFGYFVFVDNNFQFGSTIGGLHFEEAFDCAFALDSTIVLLGMTEGFAVPVTSIMFAKTCKNYMYCINDYQHYTFTREPQKQEFSLIVFPNPADGFVFVENCSFANERVLKVVLYSYDGRTYESVHPEFISKTRIKTDIRNFSEGVYILSVYTQNNVFTSKFLILRR